MVGGDGRGPSKQELVDRIHALLGLDPEVLGPGSKERKQTFIYLAGALGLEGMAEQTKPVVVRAIAHELGLPWIPARVDRGQHHDLGDLADPGRR